MPLTYVALQEVIWHDAWLYGVHRTRRDGSIFTTKRLFKCTTLVEIRNGLWKTTVTHLESHQAVCSIVENRVGLLTWMSLAVLACDSLHVYDQTPNSGWRPSFRKQVPESYVRSAVYDVCTFFPSFGCKHPVRYQSSGKRSWRACVSCDAVYLLRLESEGEDSRFKFLSSDQRI